MSASTPQNLGTKGPAKRQRHRWKIIVAADEPWVGEIYGTRPGRQRLAFNSIEQFTTALLEITGWAREDDSSGVAPSCDPEGTRRR